MTQLSEYYTLDEAIKSPNAIRLSIENKPNAEQLQNMIYVAVHIGDDVRRWVGGSLAATSFFRCKALNDVTPGSSKTSQHMTGEAMDLDADVYKNGTNRGIFDYIRTNLEFDQLILEYPDAEGRPSWIHASLKRPPYTQTHKNRGEVLVKLRAKYIPYADYKIGMV